MKYNLKKGNIYILFKKLYLFFKDLIFKKNKNL